MYISLWEALAVCLKELKSEKSAFNCGDTLAHLPFLLLAQPDRLLCGVDVTIPYCEIDG